MPLKVTELQPGDRVVLNCPKARGNQKREAQFKGIYHSIDDAMKADNCDVLAMGPMTEKFLSSGGRRWAAFLLQTTTGPGQLMTYPGGDPVAGLPPFPGATRLTAAFVVEPDGGMREEQGRRVFIERRLVMGHG
jgi:hypothetical protein